MIVSQVSNFNSTNYNNRNVNFKSIHYCRYFVKESDGQFRQVMSMEQTKMLQRKLISMLNKGLEEVKSSKSKIKKSSKTSSAQLKEVKDRLVRFFMNNDSDYSNKQVVRSFYSESLKSPKSYILSGDMVDFVDKAAKPIGKKKNLINQQLDKISEHYGISKDHAKSYLQGSMMELRGVTGEYQTSVSNAIGKELLKNNPNDKMFDAYFVPVIKGNKIDYQLFHANFIAQW